MKLDSETIYAHSTLASKPDSQFFRYDNNTVETAWKVNNDTVEEDKRRFASDPDNKKSDTNADSLLTTRKFGDLNDAPRRNDLTTVENSINGGGEKNEDVFHSEGVELFEKEAEFYTDKSVTELEVARVCFEEFEDGGYNVVKDICVDDGLPSLDKILVENGEICRNGSFSSMHSDSNGNADLTKENGENIANVFDGTNPFMECDGKIDVDNKYELESGDREQITDETVIVDSTTSSFSVTNPFAECDSMTDVAEKFDSESSTENWDMSFHENMDSEAPISNGTNPFLECDKEADVADKSGTEKIEEDLNEIMNVVSDDNITTETSDPVQELDENSSDSSNLDKKEDQQQSNQDTSKEEHSAEAITCNAEDSSNCSQAKESEVENESIGCDIASVPPLENGKEKELENIDSHQTGGPSSRPSIEEETVDGRTASSRSFFIQHGFGETSFSATGPLSGPIAYSGRIPYSGSISLRSDSSTTSTRSFAFPILPSEWNSSPVKMAKPDRRHLRKHRGWMLSILCCRF